ncbi:MAG TPA: ComEC/Rec2 family competence protein [Candidatus Paceibacterota bacterium]|nr:ComEC/Rec2 family competence protein [Candidatus Paceibacterota bacterium]
MGSRIFWALCVGFLCGVFVRSFVPVGWSFVALLALFGSATLVFQFIDREKAQTYTVVAVTLFACAAGIARMHVAVATGDPSLTADLGKNVILGGIILQEPDARDTTTLVTLDVSTLVGANVPVHAGVLVQLPAHARVAYGEHVQVSGTLKLPEAFDTGLGRQFEYPEYLAAQGIQYQLGYAKIDSILGQGGDPIKKFSIRTKELFLQGLDYVLPDPEAALAGGITVGDKRSVGPDLSRDFQRDSLVHMIVLSGYNITVVLNAVARLLAWAPRSLQFGGSIATVVFFICMSGGASSATRAGLMALIAVFARATHRTYLGERVLASASLVMVAWDPWTLCFDPSFQLSALATLGLILFTPTFAGWFSRVPEKLGAREILASTCATQLMVLPLLLYQNGTLSLVALPANLLALLPVPWAMFFSLVAALAGMLFGGIAAMVALPAYALLWYVISVAHLFASLPFAAISIPAFSAWWIFLAYATLLGSFAAFKKKTAG